MKFVDVELSSWAPKLNTFLYREAPRPPIARAPDYEDRFDYTTLFYDAFWSEDGTEIIVVCPPPLNLAKDILDGEYFAVPSGQKCDVKVDVTGPIHNLKIAVSKGTQGVKLVYSLGEYYIAPQPNFCRDLAGQRLLVTQSKNNPLHWIQDWAFFHVKMHGCTGVVFYDNNSDRYAKYDIRNCLKDIPGLEVAYILDWPSLYGARVSYFGGNESRYLQRGMLEHCKYRFAARAASLLHNDIDELIISKTGQSVFEAAENSETGYLSIPGVWVERVTDDGIEPPVDKLNHRTFKYISRDGGRISKEKLCVAPARMDLSVYWTTHRAYKVNPDFSAVAGFGHRHMFGMKTVESDERNKLRLGEKPFGKTDLAVHEEDPILAKMLEACFESKAYRDMPKVSPYRQPQAGDIWRKLAGARFSARDYKGALDLVQHAIALEPAYPSYHQFMAQCLITLNKPEEAAIAEEKAAKLRAVSPEYRNFEIRQVKLTGSKEELREKIEKLIGDFPDSAEAHFEYGVMMSSLGMPHKAEPSFRRAIELGGENCINLWRWGMELHRHSKYSEAADVFRRMLALPPRSFEDWVKAYRGLSFSLERSDRKEEALSVLQEAQSKIGQHGKMSARIQQDFDNAITRLSVR